MLLLSAISIHKIKEIHQKTGKVILTTYTIFPDLTKT